MSQQQGSTDEYKTADELSHERPSKAVAVHELIRQEGEKELRRDFLALFWSAIAAGLTMSTSLLGRGAVQAYLPDEGWRLLVESAGYTLGFIFVITAGQQLFTENTVTPVLPFMTKPSVRQLVRLLRLWGSVLLGNAIGGLIAAAVFAWLPILPPEVDASFRKIGHHLLDMPAGRTFATAILAGWLIATLVWMLRAVEQGKILLIFLVTYLMGITGVAHVVVGIIEVSYLALLGEASAPEAIVRVILPALVGNVIGGTFIFALISHAQVRADM